MTASEALVLLNDMEFAEQYQGKSEYTEMLLLCKEALEKQIPKKAISQTVEVLRPQKDNSYLGTVNTLCKCPFCGEVVNSI